MGSGRTLKLVVCELLQFAGLCVPLIVVMQRFAAIVAKVQGGGSTGGAYWLIVASSVAYVTSVALLVWVPLKYMVFAKKRFLVGRKKWRPVALVFVIVSTMPCFAFLIASSEVQIRNNLRHDTFGELPVSLILFSLICMDVVERIRHCRLTGQDNPARETEIPSSVVTHVEQVTPINPAVPGSVITGSGTSGPRLPGQVTGSQVVPAGTTGQRGSDRSHIGSGLRTEPNGTVPRIPGSSERGFRASESGSHVTHTRSGPLRFLWASDARADVFVDGFMFWMDTAEMTRAVSHPLVCYSGWVCPIYVFCCLSCLRVAVTPHDPLLSSLGVVLQDLPFLFVRAGLLAFIGLVTPLLYLLKNLLVCFAFIYFNFMTKLRIFNTQRMYL
ncbi:transmembrane protein 236-like [Hippocampus zosterae]|uniref:transmembrane protein 236-like n=1 Tax=Hippocampus zosterae TaxID=109293 RepID=UPI00223E83A5|nr:transmembrane protein 236-like [Hippocampus zosterae]XP_051909824.1 transmembrane protein 236-like [Hippocampus zosterae]XP_051909825.1 transmembrane protein 236-like [Hippocampus zosterae]